MNNERTERQKLFDKKSSEIEEIKAKVKMQLESMKSERDFISRELDLSKEALRKKDRKIKEIANGIVEKGYTFHDDNNGISLGEKNLGEEKNE